MRRVMKRLALPTGVLVALAAGALVQGAAAGDTANDFVHHLVRVTQKQGEGERQRAGGRGSQGDHP